MVRDKQRIIKMYIIVTAILLVAEAGIIHFVMIPYLGISVSIVYHFSDALFGIGFLLLILYTMVWCISNKIYKGLKYAFLHAKTKGKIRKSLKNAGYYIEQNFRGEKVAVLPKIILDFSKDFQMGTIAIENHIKLDKRLEEVDISSALGKYIVTQQYISDDANFYVYEFEDASIDRQLVFNSYKELAVYAHEVGDYKLFMDSKNIVPISSLLLVGSTGSGKSYSTYSLILTMLNWKNKPDIMFADPKNSSLVVLGNHIAPEHTAGTIEDIIVLLERFHDQMQERKLEIQDKLNEKLDADYRYWSMPANVFIFDEFASFQSVINTMDKKTRDKVAMLLRNIVLQGRQLGFFLWILMQKSDATDLPTSIRDNLIWKVVLGNATSTTYITTFEKSADLTIRKFRCGQGLYSYQGLTRQPQLTSFPTLNFDILESVRSCNGVGVM